MEAIDYGTFCLGEFSKLDPRVQHDKHTIAFHDTHGRRYIYRLPDPVQPSDFRAFKCWAESIENVHMEGVRVEGKFFADGTHQACYAVW